MRYYFQPRMCMLQWRHSGLVNYLNRTADGFQVRVEGCGSDKRFTACMRAEGRCRDSRGKEGKVSKRVVGLGSESWYIAMIRYKPAARLWYMIPKSLLDAAKAFLCWDVFPDLAIQLVAAAECRGILLSAGRRPAVDRAFL